jgi:hypothetical protein
VSIPRKKRPIARPPSAVRDARLFVIACDDKYAPKQYFEALRNSRIQLLVIPAESDSAPQQVVNRLLSFKQRGEWEDSDQFWMIIDRDHHFEGNHVNQTKQAILRATQNGASIAVSNPCFEVWLLLHHEDLTERYAFETADNVVSALKKACNGYDKCNIDPMKYDEQRRRTATARARQLDSSQGTMCPQDPGSHLYKLMEEIIPEYRPIDSTPA